MTIIMINSIDVHIYCKYFPVARPPGDIEYKCYQLPFPD